MTIKMTKVLLMAAALGLVASSAGACEMQKSAQAKVDTTTVASVDKVEPTPMSTAEDPLPAETSGVVKDKVE